MLMFTLVRDRDGSFFHFFFLSDLTPKPNLKTKGQSADSFSPAEGAATLPQAQTAQLTAGCQCQYV